jgi:hypothetical protein
MLTDGDALELQVAARGVRANQAEVGGATAHVAHEQQALVGDDARERVGVCGDPGVDRGDRLLDERELGESRLSRRVDGQLACLLVRTTPAP